MPHPVLFRIQPCIVAQQTPNLGHTFVQPRPVRQRCSTSRTIPVLCRLDTQTLKHKPHDSRSRVQTPHQQPTNQPTIPTNRPNLARFVTNPTNDRRPESNFHFFPVASHTIRRTPDSPLVFRFSLFGVLPGLGHRRTYCQYFFPLFRPPSPHLIRPFRIFAGGWVPAAPPSSAEDKSKFSGSAPCCPASPRPFHHPSRTSQIAELMTL